MRDRYRSVFTLIGVVFILVAAVVDYAFICEIEPGKVCHPSKMAADAKEAFLAIGVAVLAVAVIDALWSKLGGDPLSAQITKLARFNDLLGDAEKTGVHRIHSKTANAPNPNWKERICSCRKCVDLTGYQLLDLVDSQAVMDAIAERANAGVMIRVLLPDENSPWLEYAVSDHNLASMKANMAHARSRFQALRAGLTNQRNLEIKSISLSTTLDAAIRRFDDTMLVINYLHGINTGDSPVTELKHSNGDESLFSTYTTWFERIYDAGQTV